MDKTLETLAVRLGAALADRGALAATAESCTGGWIAATITAVAGSSGWFDRGFVTYSNEAKRELLGVAETTLTRHGAVSEPVARERAEGALRASRATFAVAVTGVAGPGGGSAEKPVGTVCFGWSQRGGASASATHRLAGDRNAVRRQSVILALEGLIERADEAKSRNESKDLS